MSSSADSSLPKDLKLPCYLAVDRSSIEESVPFQRCCLESRLILTMSLVITLHSPQYYKGPRRAVADCTSINISMRLQRYIPNIRFILTMSLPPDFALCRSMSYYATPPTTALVLGSHCDFRDILPTVTSILTMSLGPDLCLCSSTYTILICSRPQ